MKPAPLKRIFALGRARLGFTETPSAVWRPVIDAVFAGLPCSVSVSVNFPLPFLMKGVLNTIGLSSPSAPLASVWMPGSFTTVRRPRGRRASSAANPVAWIVIPSPS